MTAAQNKRTGAPPRPVRLYDIAFRIYPFFSANCYPTMRIDPFTVHSVRIVSL